MSRDRYAEAMLDLFASDGWEQITDQMTQQRDALVETAWTLNTERDLWRRKGQIEQLNAFLAAETNFRHELEEAEREKELEDAWV